MPWRGPRYEGEFPSLGDQVVAWIEQYLVHGPGDVVGEPIVLDDEFYEFVVRAYRLVPETGRRQYRRAFLSRAKGRAKSELAGMLVCAEALGPVRFVGWDANGEPVGRPVKSPFIRCLATEEGQSGNTYDNVAVMMEHLADRWGDEFPGIDFGRTAQSSSRIILHHQRGEITPSTASSAAKDGGKETFGVFDEALALDTPLPTPSGWTTMGAVQVGDMLIGADGSPVRVIKTTGVMVDRDCWRVTFADGTSMVASDGHMWLTRVNNSAALPKVRTTGEMVADGRQFRVPRAKGLNGADIDLPIDPYVLGVWIGDGDRTNATVTASQDDVDGVAAEIERRGYTTRKLAVRDGRAKLLYVSLPGSHRNRFSPVKGLKVRLREQGLLGNKHIPSAYLRAGREQRLELLRGLMDSDGYVSRTGHCTWVQTDKGIVDGFVELLRSLGQEPRVIWCADDRSRCGGVYKVHFTPRDITPASLPRKAARIRSAGSGADWVTITGIERVKAVPVRCVGVEADDHLFVAGEGWKVTHNTHLYTLPELRRMHEVVRRNLRKRREAEPWALETSTMYQRGMGSVAEKTHEYYQAIVEGKVKETGLLFDHRQATDGTDLSDRDALIQGLREAYGPAAEWMDLDGIIAEIWDPQSDPSDSRRYWLNQPSFASDAWLTQTEWGGCVDLEKVVADGERITLGFDGSKHRERYVTDATALIGCRVSDGHLFELAVWEQPEGPAGEDWWVPTVEVEAAVRSAFDRYRVVGFYADPAADWRSFVAKWEAEYGSKLKARSTQQHPIEWWMNRPQITSRALEQLRAAIVNGELTHDGSFALTRHMLNARRRESRSGLQISKEHPQSARKIDAAIAAMLAWQARMDALAKGLNKQKSGSGRVVVLQ